MFEGSRGSVQVTKAGGLTSFLHEGSKLELFPGQKTYMLQQKRLRVSKEETTQDFKCVTISAPTQEEFQPHC